MMRIITALLFLALVSGCGTPRRSETITALIMHVPHMYPTYQGVLTPEQAGTTLALKLPVEVTYFDSTWGGYRVTGWIRDAEGKYLGMRRVVEDWEEGAKFYLVTWKPAGGKTITDSNATEHTTQVLQSDKQLAAFAVLCLDWVDKSFPKAHHSRIRNGEPPNRECSAQSVLNLFRAEMEDDSQQSPGDDVLKAAPQE